MEPLYFVMAIMGCGDGAANCAQTRVEPVHYATAQQCQAAMPAALIRNSDIDYPVVSAACRSVGQQMVQISQDHRRG
ncbi:hypothetical protein GCM10009087_56830 [Sphingomonas oligophenolica]|uniref:UrcA family protein n=1 Tax=Sphingomonas oligophenolica TaxID=301154 RepID=A0ABU9Y8W8_9SPHN